MSTKYEVRFVCHVYFDHAETVINKRSFNTLDEAQIFLNTVKTNMEADDEGEAWLDEEFLENGTINRIDGIYELIETKVV